LIEPPYVLFTRIPVTKNNFGEIFCDPLWAKDIELHLKYIVDFNLCCPVQYSNQINGLTNISDLKINFIYELKRDFGLSSILKNFFPNFKTVKLACQAAEIVHSEGAGWAFPLSFYILFLKPFISFKWIIVIESSFWMMEKTDKKTFRKVAENYVHKILLTRALASANARIFTQSFYREYFLGGNIERTLINPATWVNEADIITHKQLDFKYSVNKRKIISIIYPSRLVEDKGVFVVLSAIKKLIDIDDELHLTIIGSGDLASECKKIAIEKHGNLKVEFLQPVKYGDEFFKLISEFDYVLVPTLKQEQPRIIFDAFSQGLSVIASDTSGVLDVTNEYNAHIFTAGDSSSLAKTIKALVKQPKLAHTMGAVALDYAKNKTHYNMHLNRQKFLEEVLL
jgi:glycosyltransferase involved in cell wall biosynthesis